MKETQGLIKKFVSPLVVSDLRQMPAQEVVSIVAAEQAAMSFGAKCKNYFLLNDVNPDTIYKTPDLIEVYYYSPDDPYINGKIWVQSNRLPRMAQYHDFFRGDVITIAENENQEPLFVYNHDTNAVNGCFDFKKNSVAASYGIFPFRNYNKHAQEALDLFFNLKGQGHFSEQGVNPRAEPDTVPVMPMYSSGQVRQGYWKAFKKGVQVFVLALIFIPVIAFVIFAVVAFIIYKMGPA